MSVRAKFRVQTVFQSTDNKGVVYSENVTLTPVYSDDPNSENRAFWEATPSGQLQMWISNRAVFGYFIVGQEYYLDLTLVENTE